MTWTGLSLTEARRATEDWHKQQWRKIVHNAAKPATAEDRTAKDAMLTNEVFGIYCHKYTQKQQTNTVKKTGEKTTHGRSTVGTQLRCGGP